jgi:HD-like signal output (HDOD) protein
VSEINVSLFLLLIAVLIFLFAYGRKKRRTTARASQQSRTNTTQRPRDPSITPSINPGLNQSPAAQKPPDSLTEPPHAIPEITYAVVPEGIVPKVFNEVDSKFLKTVREKISQVKPIPSNSVKLLDLLKNPFSNWNDISAVVSTNPVFSAKILQAVNSAYFNLPDKVTSVGRAITLLGYNNVRSLVLEDVLETLTAKNQNGGSDAYVKACVHSAVVSACSGYLSKNVFHTSEYDIATIGLLHDIGKYFTATLEPLSGTLPQHPLYWLKTVRPRPPLIIREQIEYGMDHAMLGSLLADRWELSEAIKYSIEYHHYPSFMPPESIPKPYITQSFAICLSDLICKALGYGTTDDEILPIRPEYFEIFGLNPNPLELITPALTKEVTNAYFTVKAYVGKADEGIGPQR